MKCDDSDKHEEDALRLKGLQAHTTSNNTNARPYLCGQIADRGQSPCGEFLYDGDLSLVRLCLSLRMS